MGTPTSNTLQLRGLKEEVQDILSPETPLDQLNHGQGDWVWKAEPHSQGPVIPEAKYRKTW